MKGKIGVTMAAIWCLLFLPVIVQSQYTPKQMERMQAAGEWMATAVMCAYTAPLLEWSKSLYDEGEIAGEDCAKVAEAVKTLAEVFGKRAEKIKNATVKKEAVAYAKCIVAEADAYVKYYKGDKKAIETAEKFSKEAEMHTEAINKYLNPEE